MKKYLVSFAVLCLCLLAVPMTKVEAASVKLNKTKVTVYEHKTTKIKVDNTKKKVTWKSKNSKIASVKNGVISGKKNGKTDVTARVNGKTYTCKVTVKKAGLSASKLTLTQGKTKKLVLNGAYKKVTYKSSNSKVVSVKNGTLKAVKPGTAQITVKHNGKSYTCKVTVKAEKIISIKLDKRLFQDKDTKTELTSKLKIKSQKTSGNYIICNVTKSSYDNLLRSIRSEINAATKDCVKKCKAIKKITYSNDYKTIRIYWDMKCTTQAQEKLIENEMMDIFAANMAYQCVKGTVLEKFDMKIVHYNASNNKVFDSSYIHEIM